MSETYFHMNDHIEDDELEAEDADSDDLRETVYLELDPARTMMYRMAREDGGEVVDALLADQIEQTIQNLYDRRKDLAAEVEGEGVSVPEPPSPAPQGGQQKRH